MAWEDYLTVVLSTSKVSSELNLKLSSFTLKTPSQDSLLFKRILKVLHNPKESIRHVDLIAKQVLSGLIIRAFLEDTG